MCSTPDTWIRRRCSTPDPQRPTPGPVASPSSSSTVNQTEIRVVRPENVPMQVITLRLTKENYFSWSPAMTMGIAGRGHMAYIDGSNPEPARTSDQALHVAQEWENRVFLFLAGLNDEFKSVRSQILNSGEVSSIEDVYSCVEAKEQRRLVTNEGKRDLVPSHDRSALVSHGPGGQTRPLHRCAHCKKTGHTVDYCWDLHPEKKGNRGRSSIGKTPVSEVSKSSGEKLSISADQIRELRAYWAGSMSTKSRHQRRLRLIMLLQSLAIKEEGCDTGIEKAIGCLDRSTLDEVLGQRRGDGAKGDTGGVRHGDGGIGCSGSGEEEAATKKATAQTLGDGAHPKATARNPRRWRKTRDHPWRRRRWNWQPATVELAVAAAAQQAAAAGSANSGGGKQGRRCTDGGGEDPRHDKNPTPELQRRRAETTSTTNDPRKKHSSPTSMALIPCRNANHEEEEEKRNTRYEEEEAYENVEHDEYDISLRKMWRAQEVKDKESCVKEVDLAHLEAREEVHQILGMVLDLVNRFSHNCPNLRLCAIKVLSQTCSASGCKRKWSEVFSNISTARKRTGSSIKAKKHASQFDPISLENFEDLEPWIEEEPTTIFDNDDLQCFHLEVEATKIADEGEPAGYVGEDLQILEDEDEEEDGDEDENEDDEDYE
ncbi:hypothetical protein EJ110_NYTH54774 [Nymphaea thermarum]|nr:hypothetical protein EJ110_NYTH54774 [Nymphaea thermarum]